METFQDFSGQEKSPSMTRISLVYLALLVATVLSFFVIQYFGERLPANSAAAGTAVTHSVSNAMPDILPRALLALLVIVVTARFFGAACERMGQPRVIGEVIAGILLGPSLFGRIAPEGMAYVFPEGLNPILGFLAQLGVILYMFLVGLELNSGLLRLRAHATVIISHTSILLPFLLGALLALPAFSRYSGVGVSFTSFALFLGVAMSITAFPVLARILTDLKLDKTELGVIALGCAAADDLTAWCLLAFVVGIAKSDFQDSVRTILLAGAYVCFMIAIARPAIRAWLLRRRDAALSTQLSAWILVAVLGSSMITESIGIHAIFGAFLLGAVIPYDSYIAASFRHRLEDVVSVLLLPTFFAYTGTRTQIGLLSASADWYFCLLIIGVATAGKFGGTLVASRFTGLDWRTSASLGTLMNTRGLMELIVLNIGLDLGVISPILFAMMVLMALVTTVATTPILRRIIALPTQNAG